MPSIEFERRCRLEEATPVDPRHETSLESSGSPFQPQSRDETARERAGPGFLLESQQGAALPAFEHLVASLQREAAPTVIILDIGGTNSFWEQRGWAGRDGVRIVTVNLEDHAQL